MKFRLPGPHLHLLPHSQSLGEKESGDHCRQHEQHSAKDGWEGERELGQEAVQEWICSGTYNMVTSLGILVVFRASAPAICSLPSTKG
jgi:hypothetical protein